MLLAARYRAEARRRTLVAWLNDPAKPRGFTDALALASRDHDLARMRVKATLIALPGVSEARADRLLAEARITPRRRLGALLDSTKSGPALERLTPQGQRLVELLAANRNDRPQLAPGWPYSTEVPW